jgi:hypothetical protein
MQLTFKPARLTGFAILAVASASALSVGACSKHEENKAPATSAPASANANDNAKDSVSGLIASVSGDSVQVNQAGGTATVNVSATTKITEYTTAQLTDIAAGSCVSAVSAPQSPPAPGGAVTAKSVKLVPQVSDGKCPQPKNAQPGAVIGTVASVAGNTIKVNVTDGNGNPAETDVTFTDTTQYTREASATPQAIAQGKCLSALGTKDGGGTLQAKAVALGPAYNGKCP